MKQNLLNLNLSEKIIKAKDNPDFYKIITSLSIAKFADIMHNLCVISALPPPEKKARKIIWKKDGISLRCIDFDPSKPTILFIPSLINKYYILDLNDDLSFLSFFHQNGYNTIIIDWGDLTHQQYNFGVNEYIQEYQQEIISWLYNKLGKKIILCGYCLGGAMALAAAITQEIYVEKVIFLATPWDFHAKDTNFMKLSPKSIELLKEIISYHDYIPGYITQQIFYFSNIFHIHDKFAQLPKNNDQYLQKFIQIESWANDPADIAKRVFQECFIDIIINNKLMNNKWKIDKLIISPDNLNIPNLAVIPTKDRLVSKNCALALAKDRVIYPETGHIGIISSDKHRKNILMEMMEFVAS